MKRDFQEWMLRVKRLLFEIGYNQSTILSEEHWEPMYNEGYGPFSAIREMEFGGKLSWSEYRRIKRGLKSSERCFTLAEMKACWEAAQNHNEDTSDFPMGPGPHTKASPDFDTFILSI